MMTSGEQPCYSLINVPNDVEFPSEAQLKDKFEHGLVIIKFLLLEFRWYESEDWGFEKINFNDSIWGKDKSKFDDVCYSFLPTINRSFS